MSLERSRLQGPALIIALFLVVVAPQLVCKEAEAPYPVKDSADQSKEGTTMDLSERTVA